MNTNKIRQSDCGYILFYLAQNPSLLQSKDIDIHIFDKDLRALVESTISDYKADTISISTFASRITSINANFCELHGLGNGHYTGGDNIPELDSILARLRDHARENVVDELLEKYSPLKFDGGDRLSELHLDVSELIDTVSPASTTIKSASQVFADLVSHLEEEKYSPIRTGVDSLDALLGGGIYPSLTVIAARTSIGKTIMLHDMCRLLADQGRKSLFFTFEMQSERLYSRWITRDIGATVSHLRKFKQLTQSQQDKIIDSGAEISSWPVHIDSKTHTPESIERAISSYISIHGKPEAIFVDYLQIFKGGKNDIDKITRAIQALQNIYKKYNVAVIAAAQINRAFVKAGESSTSEYTNCPSIQDIKGAGSVEESCDNIITLTRNRYEKEGEVYFSVGKCRDGQLGETRGYFLGRRQTMLSNMNEAHTLFPSNNNG